MRKEKNGKAAWAVVISSLFAMITYEVVSILYLFNHGSALGYIIWLISLVVIGSVINRYMKTNMENLYPHKFAKAGLNLQHSLSNVDFLDGIDFERACASILVDLGYQNVRLTKASGDGGVDILAKDGMATHAIQCKRSESPIGISAVQQVFAGKSLYNAQIAIVLTNNTFTQPAIDAATRLGVVLWGRRALTELMRAARSRR